MNDKTFISKLNKEMKLIFLLKGKRIYNEVYFVKYSCMYRSDICAAFNVIKSICGKYDLFNLIC